MSTIKTTRLWTLLVVLSSCWLINFKGYAQCSPPKPVLDSPANYTICTDGERPVVNLHFNINNTGCNQGELTLKLYQNNSFLRNLNFAPAYPGSDRMLATVQKHDYFVADGNTANYKLYVFKNGGGSGQPAQFNVTNSTYQNDEFDISNGGVITDGSISQCSQDEINLQVIQHQNVQGSFTWRDPNGTVLDFGENITISSLMEGQYSATFYPSSAGCTPGNAITHTFQVNLLDTPHPLVITPGQALSTCAYNTNELRVALGDNVVTTPSYEWRLHNSLSDPGNVIGQDAIWVEVPAISSTKYVSCTVTGLFGNCTYQQSRRTNFKIITVTQGAEVTASDFYITENCGYTRVRKQTANPNLYWQTDPNDLTFANNLPFIDFQSSGTIWLVSNESGCWGTPYPIDVEVSSLNIAPNKPTFSFENGVYTLIKGTQNPAYDYYWQTFPEGIALNGEDTFEVSSADTYYLRGRVRDTGCWLSATRIVLPDFNPTTLGTPITSDNTNSFTTYTYQTNDPVIDRDNASPDQVLVSKAYHDGLGRILQQVDKQASPAGNDMVMPYQYDLLGRNSKQYLPFASNANDGSPVGQPYTSQHVFYQNTQGVASSGMPFSLADYESSPLDRMREQASPGEEWAGNILSVDSKSIKSDYYTNTDGEVIKWQIGNLLPNKQYDYPANELTKIITTDEEGHQIIEFSDKLGQTLLKRVQVDEGVTQWADTYYLYDNFGSLQYVLPPMATANINEYLSSTPVNKQKFMDRWAYQYQYDVRRRMVAKRVPGADWVYMVYDQRDRPVLTQDGNQRLSGEWLFTKYDQLNRPIITGRYNNTADRATLQTLVNNQMILTESFDVGSEYLGYTNVSFPDVAAEDYLTVTYYDNYHFHHANIVDYSFQSTPANPGYFSGVKGQVTGSMTKVLDSDKWIRSVVYYDDRYRVIQQVGDNHNDGLDRITNEYDFVGKLLSSRSSHFRPSAIVWTNQKNVSEESSVFTATSNNWNSGFSSVNILAENADGAFETVITSTKNKYIGFNTHDIITREEGTYYVYSTSSTTQAKYQGTVKASFAALQVGDVLRMEREEDIVSIYVNGNLKHQYTTPSTEAMVIDVALYNQASAGHFSSSFSIPHAESPYPLLLTGLYNVTPSGSGLIKDRNGWSSNASSVNRLERFANGWLSFEAVTTNKSLIIGLSEHDLNKSYNAINYGIYLKSDGKVLAYENAKSKGNFGSYQAGDVFKIERIGDKIYYSRNGTVFYTSLTPSTSSLIADMALNSQHGEVTNLKASFYVDFPKEQNIVTQRDFDYDHGNRLINTWHTVEEEVSWKAIVNLEESSVGFTKISGSGNGWTAGSSSEEMIPEGQQGYLRFTANGNATKRIIGLSTQDLDASWNNVEYAIYLNNGKAEIRENGSTNLLIPAEPYNDGDEFRVERKEGMIYYWRNDDLLRTSTGTDEALLVDISILTIGHTLEDVYLSNQGKVLLAHNEYNEIGELIEKNLHSEDDGTSYAQSVDYRYNIRGWLTRINESDLSETEANSPEDYFGMNLAYNETLTGLNNTPSYNGNISGMTWSHRAGLEEQSESGYAYSYDPMNRIKTADYKKKNTVWANSNSFGVNNINYDLNGNITTLSRNKADGNPLDVLSYDYGSGINKSNQLLSVSDAGDDSEGFKDGNTSGHDYGYDKNGNMTEDLNKDITSITYNYLNLPHTVEKADGQRIRYIYDAAGMKLSQITESGEKHTPDLTSSNHGWRTSFISLDNPIGSIGGESNVQRFTATSGASNHLRQFFKLVPVANQHTKVSVKVYIPSSNTSVDGIRLYAGTKNKNYTPTPDQWTTITYEILATSNSVKMMMITQNDHKVASVGDEIYFKDFSYTSYSGKTTDYLGEFIYEDDQLQLIQHEEGRIVKDATTDSWEYQYHLRDHLGNTRTTFTTKPKEIVFNVSYEGNTDEFLLQEMGNIVDADIHDYQHQDEETNHTKTQKLTGAANSQVGSILSIPVGMGDKISAEVFAKYLPTNNQANPTAAIATLISTAFTGGTGINNELTNQAINTSFNGGSMITNSANNYTYDDQGVMAFLNVLFVPEEAEATVNTEYFAFQQISNGGTTHEQLSINDFVAPKAGYVLVYLTNEDPTYTEVYFDDLTITLNEHPVIQVDNYYPFGLNHSNGYQRISNLKNDFLYNGKEEIKDLGLDWYDYGARMYMSEIGRWGVIDPLADQFRVLSPYNYALNNPINFIDPDGMAPRPSDNRHPFLISNASNGKINIRRWTTSERVVMNTGKNILFSTTGWFGVALSFGDAIANFNDYSVPVGVLNVVNPPLMKGYGDFMNWFTVGYYHEPWNLARAGKGFTLYNMNKFVFQPMAKGTGYLGIVAAALDDAPTRAEVLGKFTFRLLQAASGGRAYINIANEGLMHTNGLFNNLENANTTVGNIYSALDQFLRGFDLSNTSEMNDIWKNVVAPNAQSIVGESSNTSTGSEGQQACYDCGKREEQREYFRKNTTVNHNK